MPRTTRPRAPPPGELCPRAPPPQANSRLERHHLRRTPALYFSSPAAAISATNHLIGRIAAHLSYCCCPDRSPPPATPATSSAPPCKQTAQHPDHRSGSCYDGTAPTPAQASPCSRPPPSKRSPRPSPP